jgi:hypothetical protein
MLESGVSRTSKGDSAVHPNESPDQSIRPQTWRTCPRYNHNPSTMVEG